MVGKVKSEFLRRVAVGAKGYLARRMLNFITIARSPPRLWLSREETREGVVADRLASTESGDGGRFRVARKGGCNASGTG